MNHQAMTNWTTSFIVWWYSIQSDILM